jgi:large subunit ribosomal protein L10
VNKEQKGKEVAILKDKLTRAKHLIIADLSGINVADVSVLRRKLKEGNSEIRVSKNTLLRLAVKDTDLQELQEHFEGPTSVIYGYDDPSVPARIIYESIKETEKPKFKSYFYDGAQYGFDFLKRIAQLPSRDVVIAILISTVEGSITQFISLLEAATRECISTVDALAESKNS